MDIDIEEVLLFVNDKVFEKTQKRLSEVHAQIFRKSWQRERYPQISVDLHLTEQHVKDEGSKLWSLLTEVFGEPVKKATFQSIIRAHQQLQIPTQVHSIDRTG